MTKVQYSYQSLVIAGQARILQNRMLVAVLSRRLVLLKSNINFNLSKIIKLSKSIIYYFTRRLRKVASKFSCLFNSIIF